MNELLTVSVRTTGSNHEKRLTVLVSVLTKTVPKELWFVFVGIVTVVFLARSRKRRPQGAYGGRGKEV